MLTFSSDRNWTYYSLSGKGAIRKQFLRAERFHRGRFLFRKQLEEVAFLAKMLSETQIRAVAARTVSIRRIESTV